MDNTVTAGLPVLLGRDHPQGLCDDKSQDDYFDVAEKLSGARQKHAFAEKKTDYESAMREYKDVCSQLEKGHRVNSCEYAAALEGLACVQADMDKFEEAIRGHIRAMNLRCCLLGESSPEVATSWHNLGLVYQLKGDSEQAEEKLKKAAELRKAVDKQSAEYATSLRALGDVHVAQGKYADALDEIKLALLLTQEAYGACHGDTAACLEALANLHCREEKFVKAQEPAEQACDINQKVFGAGHKRYACSLSRLAQMHERAGNLQEAKQHQQRSCDILRVVLGEDHGTTRAEMANLGTILLKLGEYPEAAAVLQEAHEIMVKCLGKNHIKCGASLMNLGAFYGRTGNFACAAKAFEQAAVIARKQHEMMHIHALYDLATALFDMGEFSRSEGLLQELFDNFGSVLPTDGYIHALVLQTRGQVYREKGSYEHAEDFLTRALAKMTENKTTENHLDVATLHSELGKLHAARSDFTCAKKYFEKARDIRARCLGESNRDYAESLTDLGMTLCSMNKLPQAAKLLLCSSKLDLALLHKTLPVLPALRRVQLVSSLGRAARILPMVLLRWKQSCKDDAEVEKCTQSERECFQILLQFRSILFTSQAREASVQEALKHLHGQQQEEVHKLHRELRSARMRMAALALDRHEADGTQDAVEECTARVNSLERQLSQALSTCDWASGWDVSATDLVAKVAGDLPAESALVEFVKTDSLFGADGGEPSYVVFILGGGSGDLHLRGLDSASVVDKCIEAYCSLLWSEEPVAIKKLEEHRGKRLEAGRRLRRLVLDPVLKVKAAGEASHLFVAPDGLLNLLPFYALPQEALLGQTETLYFVHEKYTLSYVLCGATLTQQRPPWSHEGSFSLVVADPDLSSTSFHYEDDADAWPSQWEPARGSKKFRNLEHALSEGQGTLTQLRQFLPRSHEVELLKGKDATATALRDRLNNSPSIFHFAGHAYFISTGAQKEYEGLSKLTNAEDPLLRCGLAMAGARAWQEAGTKGPATSCFVTGLDLLEANLRRTRLAVLSACETGCGDIWEGQGVAGLCRVAQLAGAQTVLANHWLVKDKQSATLMQQFYDKLLMSSPAEPFHLARILRDAQRELCRADNTPKKWATFSLYGCVAPLTG